MKKILLFGLIAVFAAIGCSKDNGTSDPLMADFEISKNPCFSREGITLTAKVSGGKPSFTYSWKIGTIATLRGEVVDYTFETNGTFPVVLTVTDASGQKAEKRKNLVVNPPVIPEQGEVSVNWGARLKGYNQISAPAIDDDGNIYAVTTSNILYKFNSQGQEQWTKSIDVSGAKGAETNGTPVVDANAVYLCSGTASGAGKFVAYNTTDGSVKWDFNNFWAEAGKTPKPTMYAIMPALGEGDNVYIGYAGDNGTLMSIKKSDGSLVGRFERDGKGIPGGARSGVVLSKAQTIHYYGGKWGLGGGSATALDNANGGSADYIWHIWSNAPYLAETAIPYSSLAVLDINNVPCVAGIVTDSNGTKVYAVNCETGAVVCEHRISDTAAQDQGGVVVTAEGYIVAALNYTFGQDNGGIVIVNPNSASGTQVARFRTQEKVSGTPAIDKAGNIHFFTEAGYWYIVDKNCNLLVKRNLFTILTANPTLSTLYAGLEAVKFWSSPVIGDDGKIYMQFTNDDAARKREWGGLLCLSYAGCQGPGQTQWPMIGHDRSHTNRQN